MLFSIVFISILTILLTTVWRFFNWVWIQPRRMEKILRKQGLKGNSYRFLFGDAKESAAMYKESYSRPIGIDDDIRPRVMPFIFKTIRTYGENSFMWVGPRPLVFITNVELMKVVMNKHWLFQKPFKISNPIVKRLVGGLASFEGEKWSKSRKKLSPPFHLDKIKDMVTTMQRQCGEIIDAISEMVPKDGSSGVVDVLPYIPDYTASVVSNTLFSTPYDEVVKRTFHILSELTLLSEQAKPFTIPGQQFLPTKKNRRANAIENELTTTFTNMINERIKKRNTGEINGNPDLFDMILDELNEVDIKDSKTHAMVFREIIQQCKLFFVGGFETTSNLISWTIVMLAVHQDWQARAREEAFQVLGDKNNITADDVGQLKTLNMIVHEVLRLYPPSIELTRVVEEETVLGEFCLPKGVMVMLPMIQIHLNPQIWGDDALEFKPERFAEGVLKAANGHAALIPFGWGVRNCPGYNMALFETKIFVAQFLRRFTFELSQAYKHAPLVAITTLPQYGIPLMMRKL